MATETQERKLYEAVKQSVRDADRRVGEELPNGALILQDSYVRALIRSDGLTWAEEHVVLAVAKGNFQPFVTWVRVIGTEQKSDGSYGSTDYCQHGHYFRDVESAVEDFKARVDEV